MESAFINAVGPTGIYAGGGGGGSGGGRSPRSGGQGGGGQGTRTGQGGTGVFYTGSGAVVLDHTPHLRVLVDRVVMELLFSDIHNYVI